MQLYKTIAFSLLALALALLLAAPALAGSGSVVVGYGDFDNDLDTDVVTWNASTREVNVYLVTGGNAFDPVNSATVTTLPAGWLPVGATDFTADGRADILVADTVSGILYVFVTSAAAPVAIDPGASFYAATLPAGWTVAATGDTTGDRRSEIHVENAGLIYTYVTNGTGTAIDFGASGSPLTIPAGWTPNALADFSGDGRGDVLVSNDTTGVMYVFVEAANGISIDAVNSSYYALLPAGWEVGGGGDYTADTTPKADLLVKEMTSGWTYVFATDSASATANAGASGNPIFTIPAGYNIAGTVDFGGDKRADLLIDNGGLLYFRKFNSTSSTDAGASAFVQLPAGESLEWQLGL